MKRGFINGIGTFFLAGAIWMWTQPPIRDHLLAQEPISVAFNTGYALVGILALYVATRVAPNRSWPRAIVGWLLGVAATWGVIFLLVGLLIWPSLFR